jgi:glycosyltransferase involved in cell wall biosynthesis
MHIAFIAGEYPPLEGGLGAYTRELARALISLGHRVSVFTRTVPGSAHREEVGGVRVVRDVSSWGWRSLIRLARFINTYHPDILNLQYQAAAYQMHPAINLLPRMFKRRIPVAVTFHDLRVPYLFPKAGALRWRAVLATAKGASAAIVTNVEDRATLQRARVRRTVMIPIGSNITPSLLTGFNRAAWLRSRSLRPESRVVGYFGFMNESKGGETLVRALADLRYRQKVDATLLLIGGQTGASDSTNVAYASFIMRLADDLRVGRDIALTGFLDDYGVSEALAACDCVALPYRDGASFRRGTLMAALAHACAIITTTPRVSVPELVNGQNVLLVPPDDPPALSSAICRALFDETLHARLQTGGKLLSALFEWNGIASQFVNVCQEISNPYII